jgi:hypothetical protein
MSIGLVSLATSSIIKFYSATTVEARLKRFQLQTMRLPSLTTLIGDEIQGDDKWSTFVDGKNGFLYGIPFNARRVVKFNPLDKSFTETGNDLWASGALAQDNNIYYMPRGARRIMRLDPNNDTLSSVGDDLGGGWGKYSGTVVGNDDCGVYGIPHGAKHIIKFDPTNPDTTSTVGEVAEKRFYCGNGVLAGDGYIYAASNSGQVLQIDTTINNYTWIGDPIYSGDQEWGGPIIGVDKCIYWPPFNANRVLMFDPETQQLPSLVGDDFGRASDKWKGGALATDGVIYCIPYYSTHILAIDPFKEFSTTLQTNMPLYPDELGRLFSKDEEQCDETFFESSLRKFGGKKVFQLIEECFPLGAEWADGAHNHGNLPPFMVAASCENCAASVVYYLLRRNVNGFLGII